MSLAFKEFAEQAKTHPFIAIVRDLLGFKQLARRLHTSNSDASRRSLLLAARGRVGLGLRLRRLSGRVLEGTVPKVLNPGELS
jgi:hypothetical protein